MSTLTLLLFFSLYDGSGSLPMVYKALDGMHTAVKGSGKWAGKTLTQAELLSMCDALAQPQLPEATTWLKENINPSLMRAEEITAFAKEVGATADTSQHALKCAMDLKIEWTTAGQPQVKSTPNGASQVLLLKDFEAFQLSTHSRPIIQISTKDKDWQVYATIWPAATGDFNSPLRLATKLFNDINYNLVGLGSIEKTPVENPGVIELPLFEKTFKGKQDELTDVFVFSESSQTFLIKNALRRMRSAVTAGGWEIQDHMMVSGSFDFLTFEPKFFDEEDPFRLPGGRGAIAPIQSDYLSQDVILIWASRRNYQFPVFVTTLGIPGSDS